MRSRWPRSILEWNGGRSNSTVDSMALKQDGKPHHPILQMMSTYPIFLPHLLLRLLASGQQLHLLGQCQTTPAKTKDWLRVEGRLVNLLRYKGLQRIPLLQAADRRGRRCLPILKIADHLEVVPSVVKRQKMQIWSPISLKPRVVDLAHLCGKIQATFRLQAVPKEPLASTRFGTHPGTRLRTTMAFYRPPLPNNDSWMNGESIPHSLPHTPLHP